MDSGSVSDTDAQGAGARESQLLALTGSIREAVVSIDGDQRIVFWNPAAERMFGWSEAEALGRPLTILIPDRFLAAHQAGLGRVLGGGETRLIGGPPVEMTARRRDGEEIPVELALGRYVAEARPLFTGVLRDTRERVRARRYESVQERVVAALLEDGDEVAVAERTLSALGAGLGWSLGALWLSEGDLLVCCATWSAPGLEADTFVRRSHELRLRAGDGIPGQVAARRGTLWIEDIAAAPNVRRVAEAEEAGLRSAVGVPLIAGEELVGILEFFVPEPQPEDQELAGLMEALSAQLGWVFLRKRSERQLAAQSAELAARAGELERSNEELERFAYVASHDLSEPLRTIAGFVQLLRERHAGSLDEQGLEFLDFAQQGAVRMQAIIEDLLFYSRAGRAHLHAVPVDLGTLVRDVTTALGRQIEDTGATVEIEGELPTVTGDPHQLSQLFQNLLSNAVKFHGEAPPRVGVRATRAGGFHRIAIEDNGVGIHADQRERVFEMFVRVHGREAYDGTGIGLALCRRIVERHGGTILAEPGAGGGTRIVLALPAEPERTSP